MNTLLDLAIQDTKAGRKQAAYKKLHAMMQQNPSNEEAEIAWLCLAQLLTDPAKQRTCFEKVIRLNPNNRIALNRLKRVNDFDQANTKPLAKIPPPISHLQKPTPIPSSTVIQEMKTPLSGRIEIRQEALQPISVATTVVDYITVFLISVWPSVLIGLLHNRFLGFPFPIANTGGYFLSLVIGVVGSTVIGVFAGMLIARLAKEAIGFRRGRFLSHIVVSTIVLGKWDLFAFLFAIPEGFSSLNELRHGILGILFILGYLLTATTVSFYKMNQKSVPGVRLLAFLPTANDPRTNTYAASALSTESRGNVYQKASGSSYLQMAAVGFLIIGSLAGVIYLVPLLIEWLLPLLNVIAFVFFFPITFPLTLIIVGGISTIVAPFLAWMAEAGLFLLTQRWWWFPVGWIVGALTWLLF